MSALTNILQVIVLILVVLAFFNIIIFVHELGHFLAAKWRGLQIDRFQIWFGKPIWKKEIKGVQYGLGWIPAGGFVALPQMAPMEMIEGSTTHQKRLRSAKPLDKIIVAFAGPLFSLLLALAAAVIVWQIGKPKDFIPSQEIGYVETGSPAARAGLRPGDEILKINGRTVKGFAGSLDSITESIILSRGNDVVFTVKRPGTKHPLEIVSNFEQKKTKWWQRSSLRRVGIRPIDKAIVNAVIPNSPAAAAGLKKGDRIIRVDGKTLYSTMQFSQYLKRTNWQTVHLTIQSPDGSTREVSMTPVKPLLPKGRNPMIGVEWDLSKDFDTRIIKPGPFQQLGDSLQMMWTTVTSVLAPDSGIKADHLSGPVGIGTLMFDFLQMKDGWRRILGFMVLFNVNLAVLNLLPFPVLDGGHIVLAILEKIFGRPVKAKPLEVLQTLCALLLISLMLFITTKDVGDHFSPSPDTNQKIVFPK